MNTISVHSDAATAASGTPSGLRFAEQIKVYVAATLGMSAPGANLFINDAEPLLKSLVLLGQFGVAVVTILYILKKRANIGKKPKSKKHKR